MRSRSAAWVAAAALAGCAPPPSPTASLRPTAERTVEVLPSTTRGEAIPSTSGEFRGLPGETIVRTATAEVPLPRPEFPLREMESDLLADVEAEVRRRAAEQARNTQADFDAVYERIHALFLAQAPAAGEDWARLAFLAGFPDPGLRRPPTPRTTAELEAAEAELLRAKIKGGADEFRREVLAMLEAARERRRAAQTALAVQAEVERDEARKAARLAASQWSSDRRDFVSELPQIELRLPSVSPRRTSVPGMSLAGLPWQAPTPGGWAHSERDARLQRLFLEVKGLRPGASPDKSKEYREWLGRPTASR